jgi:tetratricopeptide (TPR) repeat protein
MGTAISAHHTPKLIEREEPLTRLTRYWDDACAGRGHVALLAGEAGHGKSSLAEHIIQKLDADPRPHKTARAVCSTNSGQDEAFWPFAEAFSQLAASPRRKLTEDVLDTLLELAPEWIGMIPVAGNIVGASIKTMQVVRARTKHADEPNPDKLLREYVGALKSLTSKQPALIFIDDLQWCDAASIKLLSHLARHIGDSHALVICAYRPSDIAVADHPLHSLTDDIARYDADAIVELQPLTDAGVRLLVNALYWPNKLPNSLTAHLHEKTGGSPLFVIESLRLMEQQNEIFKEAKDGKWHLRPDWEDDLPRSVEAVIEERIGRLPDELLDALILASVQGVEFDSAVLAYVMDRDELKLMKLLEPAERVHGLIAYVGDVELDGDITARYKFTSNLFRHELTNRLRGKHKMTAFRKTAEGIDRLWPDDNEDLAARLANLYEVGKVYDRAAFFSIVAARKCRRAGEIRCAIELLEDAEKMLDRVPGHDAALDDEINEALSYLYEVDSSFDRARVRADRVLKAGLPALGWKRWAVMQMRLARLADNEMRFDDMLSTLEDVRTQLEDVPDEALSAEAFQLSAEYTRALVRVSRADEAIAHCESAIARTYSISDSSARESARVGLDGALAMALYFNGQYARCIQVAESVLPVVRRQRNVSAEQSVLISLINWCVAVGNYGLANKHLDEMVQLGESVSSEETQAHAHMLRGKVSAMQSRHEEALTHFDAADALVKSFKSFTWQPELMALRAWALVDQGHSAEARPLLIKAGLLARKSGSREWVGLVQMVQARHALIEGDPSAALGYAETAEQIFTEENAQYDLARTIRILGRCHRALGDEARALKLFDRAIALFEEMGNQQQINFTLKQRDGV